ncbi:hypothetical protein J1605_023020 [Eschrichtius robustus]|uniref:Uncharacterized protein n=1 Tax=Eschrichtius robustus TaxID=9764 RepID=A0AB34H9E6_ESCRO|nr:hypothetical protein J1605_023020 [Eschrichtius robustus]
MNSVSRKLPAGLRKNLAKNPSPTPNPTQTPTPGPESCEPRPSEPSIGPAWLGILLSAPPTLQRRTLESGAPRPAGSTFLGGSF